MMVYIDREGEEWVVYAYTDPNSIHADVTKFDWLKDALASLTMYLGSDCRGITVEFKHKEEQ